VAQHVFALILEHASRVSLHARAVSDGAWCRSADFMFTAAPLTELAGKTLGLVGFGQIGRKVAQIAHAFGMNILVHSRTQRDTPDYRPFAWVTLAELLAQADVISLHAPQTPETTGLINTHTLDQMKHNALLINTARGGLVVEKDLADALNSGRIAGAGLDVVTVEPMSADNPLRTAKNCLITPHVAWATLEARKRCMATTAANIAAFIAGRPINVVNA